MRDPRLRVFLGLTPFVLILVTLVSFYLTRDPMVFALAGVLAGVYVLFFFLFVAKRNRRTGRKKGRGRRPRS